jgi:hypothetical protein
MSQNHNQPHVAGYAPRQSRSPLPPIGANRLNNDPRHHNAGQNQVRWGTGMASPKKRKFGIQNRGPFHRLSPVTKKKKKKKKKPCVFLGGVLSIF